MIASARPTAGWSQWPDCDCLEIQSHRPESEGSTLVVKRRQGTILVVRRHSGHIRKVAGIQFFYNAVILFESGLALPGATEFNLFGRSSGARLYIYICYLTQLHYCIINWQVQGLEISLRLFKPWLKESKYGNVLESLWSFTLYTIKKLKEFERNVLMHAQGIKIFAVMQHLLNAKHPCLQCCFSCFIYGQLFFR